MIWVYICYNIKASFRYWNYSRSLLLFLGVCVQVNHINDNPGYYTCQCVVESDQCLSDGECVREDNCPSKHMEADHGKDLNLKKSKKTI